MKLVQLKDFLQIKILKMKKKLAALSQIKRNGEI